MADYLFKRLDTGPAITATITDSTGAAVNLTSAAVTFVMRPITANSPTTSASATITDAVNGKVSYTPTATDTANAGIYAAEFHVTLSGGSKITAPTDGYLEVSIEEDLVTPGGATIVSIGEVKEYLNIQDTDKSRDAKLMRMIRSVAPAIEFITGPVLQRVYQNEVYDGTGPWISLRNRPVLEVHSVTEYRGPIAYPLTQVVTPDQGTIYSYMFESPGRIVRRTVGGAQTAFPIGAETVFVTYTAGLASVPANISESACELIRAHFQRTQQGRPRGGTAGMDDEPGQWILGFYVPNGVHERLAPNRRHPSVA